MTGLPWLRLYTEYATDPKIQILAFDDQRHFVMLLCLKGNGTLDCETPSDSYRERLIAKALGLDASTASEAKRRLLEGGLITADWNPCKWAGRQCPSDHDGAERQKRYRESKKRDSDEAVTTALRDSDAIDKKRLDKTRLDTDKNQEKRARAARPPPRKRCPIEFQITDDLRTWAQTHAPDVDVDRETERMRDWEFKTGRSDWPATWRTWMDRAQKELAERPGRRRPTRAPKTPEQIEAEAADAQH